VLAVCEKMGTPRQTDIWKRERAPERERVSERERPLPEGEKK
jgi:hypothetical protein